MLSYQTTTNPIVQRALIGGVETFQFGDDTTPNATQVVGTNIKLFAPVTASGDISSSGAIISNEINTIGHITASGNISASGTIVANHISESGNISTRGTTHTKL